MLRLVHPCLPTKSATPPSGPLWLHEIKHDGFRVIACKEGAQEDTLATVLRYRNCAAGTK